MLCPKRYKRERIELMNCRLRDPHHPSLQFKRIDPAEPIYLVRIGLGYRALGVVRGNTITWYWIGTHAR